VSRRGLAAGLALLGLVLAGCAGGGGAGGGAPAVRIAVNPWVGSAANAAVVGVLLERLGYRVEKPALTEEAAWRGLATGEVDVILENWGREAEKREYVETRKVAVLAGETGLRGVIGWYVPAWMAEQYPELADWRGLERHAALFRTAETGERGRFLAGDPSFVTNDAALVRSLGLPFTVVHAGSEAALIRAFQAAAERKTPLVGYFYEPQWLHATVKLARVALPLRTGGCDADPKTVACDYPRYVLDKVVSRRFAERGGPALELVRRFRWSNADQDEVADAIARRGLTPEAAARRWLDAHPEGWRGWLLPP
jgi:glycine betaine/proline transport system substrate-binding protein